MTREEAKAWFKVLLKDEYAFNSADREAFAMAIKALEQEPLEVEATELQKAYHKGFEDCRKAVLDIVDSYSESQSNVEDVTQDIISYVVALPPVNPQPCEDAISREDALMALTGEWTEITDEIIHRFIKRIKALPPVNPQPEWIPVSERTPEHGGEYLLWGKVCDDDDEEYCFLGGYYECEEKFGIEQNNYDPHTLGFLDTEIDEYYSVVAWRPLPKPYVPRESEEE